MKILIVDDSNYARTSIRHILEEQGCTILGEAATGESAIDQIAKLKPDLITLDNILPDMTGIDILKAIRKIESKPVVIMVSAVGQQSSIEEAAELGVMHYLVKPISPEHLKNIIKLVRSNSTDPSI